MPTTPPLIPPGGVTFAQCPVVYAIARTPPPTLTADANGFSGDLTFIVNASDIASFVLFAGGSVYTVVIAGGVSVLRIVPVQHPDFSSLLCRKVSSVALGSYTPTNSQGLSNFSKAKITLTFESVPFVIDGSTPFMELNTDTGSEVYTAAGAKMSFPSDGSIIQADAGITVPTIVYGVTVYQAASLGDDAAALTAGSPVSSAPFLNRPAGTMRFDGQSAKTTMTAGAGAAYQRTLMFTFRPIPWNFFLRPNFNWEVAVKPDSTNAYATSDFNVLLQ